MAAKGIYSDPTMVAFESLYVPDNGDLSPSYAPFVGTLPPTTERGSGRGGFAVPKDLTRADYRASWAKMVELLGRMHKAGVPIVAGTDGAGIELMHELEIYVQAGFTPAEALAAATIVPAQLVGQDAKTGSIKAGKAADLVLVDGDPSKHDRRPASDARGDAGRQAARRRRAAVGRGNFRSSPLRAGAATCGTLIARIAPAQHRHSSRRTPGDAMRRFALVATMLALAVTGSARQPAHRSHFRK